LKNTVKNDLGRIQVSDEAIAEIAALAACKVPGVAGMGSGSRVESLAELLGVRSGGQGVSVEMHAREVSLRVFLIVEFGTDIADVGLRVQEEVAEAVEGMSALDVKAVDVVIQGIRHSSAERKAK
jgi:uncharacterized alkaline shock family protein YloU